MILPDSTNLIETSPESMLALLEAWKSASSLLCRLPLPMERVYEHLRLLNPGMTLEKVKSAMMELRDLIPAAFDLRARDLGEQSELHFFDPSLIAAFYDNITGNNQDPNIKAANVSPVSSPTNDMRSRLHQLLEMPSPSSIGNSYNLTAFLRHRPALSELLIESYRRQSLPPRPFVEICPHWPVVNRRPSNNNANSNSGTNVHRPAHTPACSNQIKFTAVVAAQTDPNLGDCSYLDTCFKAKGCRYLHYRVEYPRNPVAAPTTPSKIIRPLMTLGEPVSSSLRQVLPPQWINCDILGLDFTILGKFAAIIIDPPWDIHTNGTDRTAPSGVSDEDMINLPIHQIQDEGICVLWVTGRALEIGRQCLNTWGYTTVRELVWIKTNQVGRTICTGRTGHWLNHTKEHALVGVCAKPKEGRGGGEGGIPQWLHGGSDLDVLVAGTRTKSRKPDELYDIVERLVDGCTGVGGGVARKLELFGKAHNRRAGWLTIGNEVNDDHDRNSRNENGMKFDLVEPGLRRAYETTVH